jgi:hypothetical protein
MVDLIYAVGRTSTQQQGLQINFRIVTLLMRESGRAPYSRERQHAAPANPQIS